ncbi:alpha/beta hydrolase-fold protein [Shewanella sp.]|uniref:alpha/beta hydrolase-fold protein n=1 Tax=Shewanella sp. TaxID=50422 RepID=UPI0035673243
MRRIITLLLGSLLSVCALSPQVQAAEGPSSESLEVRSPLLGDEPATFTITLPANYGEDKAQKYVLLLDWHPRAQPLLAGMQDWMSHNGGWPWVETIVITPPNGHQGLGLLKSAAIETGDEALLDFVENSLLPAASAKYPSSGFKIVSGFTGNGGLVLHSLLHRPALFNAYIAISPVLSDDFAKVLSQAKSRLQSLDKSLAGKTRFLQISTSDSDFESGELEAFAGFEAVLKAYAPESLKWQSLRLDGTYYMTQPVLGIAHGIEFVFDDVHKPLTADSAISQQGVAAILAYYQHLSRDVYGFEVSAEGALTALAKASLPDAPQKAIAVLTEAAAALPTNHSLKFELATIQASLGKNTAAAGQLQQALTLTDHPFWLHHYQRMLTQLQASKEGEVIRLSLRQ